MTSLCKQSNAFNIGVRELVERGASLNVQDYQGWTPLHVAAFIGHINAMKVLLRNGALTDV